MSLRFLKKELLTSRMGKRKVKELDLSKFSIIPDPGTSCERFKNKRLKNIKNAKARAKRKAKKC